MSVPSIPKRPSRRDAAAAESSADQAESTASPVPMVPTRPQRAQPEERAEPVVPQNPRSEEGPDEPVIPQRPARPAVPERPRSNRGNSEKSSSVVGSAEPEVSEIPVVREQRGDPVNSEDPVASGPTKVATTEGDLAEGPDVGHGTDSDSIPVPLDTGSDQPREPVPSTLPSDGPTLPSERPRRSDVSGELPTASAQEHSAQLLSELRDADGDGDKTPGNTDTKTTFKTFAEEHAVSDSSSFNDDTETVLQEKEEGSGEQEPEELEELAEPTEPKHTKPKEPHQFDQPVEPSVPAECTEPEEPVEPVSVESSVSAEPSIEPPVATETPVSPPVSPPVSTEPPVSPPVSPPMSSPVPSESLTVGRETSAEPVQPASQPTRSGSMPEHAPAASVRSTPAVPRRPSRPSSESTPEPRAKAPPPKPKKLSSKIAAFQEMFSQAPPPVEAAPSVPKRPSRLSSDKVKFGNSLQGMVGRGVAMPGMVDPAQLKAGASEAEGVASDVRKGRAKGPRKRLPAAIKDAKLATSERFEVVIEDLWEVRHVAAGEQASERDGAGEERVESGEEPAESQTDFVFVAGERGVPAELTEAGAGANDMPEAGELGAAEPAAELAADPAAEPAAELAADPAAEPAAEPVAEPAEPAAELAPPNIIPSPTLEPASP
ncbi:hypothetical protein ABC855_g3465 [[Candida] zeylanoides]